MLLSPWFRAAIEDRNSWCGLLSNVATCQVVIDALMLSLISTTLRQCPWSLCMGPPFISRKNGLLVDIMVHF